MKLKEYYEGLTKFLQDNPAAANFNVVTASDSEGNSYGVVNYLPSLGNFDNDEWMCEDDCKEEGLEINAVCLN